MKKPLISRPSLSAQGERGVTMALVALAMVAIIAMAALSIDVVTLYLAKQEAQRSADSAALAAAKVIALSGITGDPGNTTSNWNVICGPDDGTNGIASRTAKAVANQNLIGGASAATPIVTYGTTGSSDCTSLSGTAFGVNPIVTVQLQRPNLPTFFSRIWGNTGNTVTASATAEVLNSSNSGNVGNQVTGTIIPVQPRSVKPWAVPNQDPWTSAPNAHGYYCNQTDPSGPPQPPPCNPLVSNANGSIQHPGISLGGTGTNGIIGETIWLSPDCRWGNPQCTLRVATPQANYNNGSGFMKGADPTQSPNYPNLVFAPGQVTTTPLAVPSCATGDDFEEAIAGSDQYKNYTCGIPPASFGTNAVDLSENPDTPISNAVSCLIHQASTSNWSESTGQDYLNPFGAPSAYPFQINPGTGNPLISAGLSGGTPITVSPSIVSLPIYDQASATLVSGGTTQVTFVGFLQVFINSVDQFGNVNVTVLNVSGCGNGSGDPVGTQLIANSPIPVRLITPPAP